jgi:hypothetical protein
MEKENAIALITGATAGIGEATATEFARQGWDVIITGRRKGRLETLARSLQKEFGVDVLPLVFDVRNREETFRILNGLTGKWSSVDVLVNNAGLAAGRDAIDAGDPDDWDRMIDTNVKGLLYVSHCIIPLMRSRKKGHIINIGSIAGKEAYKDGNVYCASKFAVDALSQSMRIDLLAHNIRVTSISPGMVETEFSLVRFKGDEARAGAVYQGLAPLQPQDVADVIWFAVSRPAHVGINDIVITPTAQANSYYTYKP